MTKKVVAQVCDLVKELGEGAGKVQAVKKTNLSINSGELTLLMGPSGSGKTTLISILGCILTPTSGEVIIDGENTTGMSAGKLADIRRRHIGFIFQSYNLFPTLNAIENVRLALDVRGSRGALSRDLAEKALVAVGLSHRMKSYPKQMSGGEQQRVAIARAIAPRPALIFADEPTGNLDVHTGEEIVDLLFARRAETGATLLIITHDPELAEKCERVLTMADGLIASDRPGTNPYRAAP